MFITDLHQYHSYGTLPYLQWQHGDESGKGSILRDYKGIWIDVQGQLRIVRDDEYASAPRFDLELYYAVIYHAQEKLINIFL